AELKSSVEIIPVSSMEEAVLKSSQIAKTGDIVLLSPGAASFNLFKNEFDRGDQFGKYVRKL
ncbi:UDP-N-acetylmuramoyl-L-alanine--D-glutamate ligase, partial [Patescibacteria group bacterium]|nr:UDP-N-acetylmuramoyl-L-alanine--D-glutamate ligase [Patescibacteria group bacterium]MBU4461491.1 UDP-N-acetylmuramoyl-L-alanine--D-glutamate ligase [Patescibacteria group bacterium]